MTNYKNKIKINVDLSPNIKLIPLNVTRPNSPIKRDYQNDNTEKKCYKNKKAGLYMLILYEINFKRKSIIQDEEVHFLMIKESIQLEDISIINVYMPEKPQNA